MADLVTEEIVCPSTLENTEAFAFSGTLARKGIRRVRIMENKPVFHKDGSITAIWDRDYFDVGMSVLRRLQRGSAFVCIRHKEGKVIHVKVLKYQHVYDYYGISVDVDLPCVYLMYPEQSGSSILPWKDSYTYLEPSEVITGFRDSNGSALIESGRLRLLQPNTHEEWFWCSPDEQDDECQELASNQWLIAQCSRNMIL